jgi:hypothetical protein
MANNKYNSVIEPKKSVFEYADTFPVESYTFSYLNAHYYLGDITLNRDLKSIETLNNKCMTCHVNLVLFKHKECQKCYFINAFVKDNIQYAIYLIYSQIPCFCFDCLDYYGMSLNMRKDHTDKKDLNELQNLFDHKDIKDKFNKQIELLSSEIKENKAKLLESNKKIKKMTEDNNKEYKKLKK